MLYHDYLKKLNTCPFCASEDRILASNKRAYLTYAKAPYHKHHLLVTPKKHIVSFFDLSKSELLDMDELIKLGTKILKKLKYNNFTILVREGDQSNKSIRHLHYHLIPNDPIGDLNHIGKPRKIMTPKEIGSISKQITSIIGTI